MLRFFPVHDDSDADPTYQLDLHGDESDSDEGVDDPSESVDEPDGGVAEFGEGGVDAIAIEASADVPKIRIQGRSNKKNYCPFCLTAQSKFARHVFRKHKREMEVQRALASPVGSRERRALLEKLVRDGNFKHNSHVINSGEGILVPGRCPPESVKASREYLLPCAKCTGFFSRKNLYRHKCNVHANGRHQAEGRYLMPHATTASEDVRRLMASMREDDVATACKNDQLIVEFGSRLFTKLGHEPHQHAHIREKMRELGRLLLELKKTNPDASLESYIKPAKFLEVVEAVKQVTGAQDGSYKNPSLAIKLGYSLGECAGILKTRGIIQEDSGLKAASEDFLALYRREWKLLVSTRARGTLYERQWNRPDKLRRRTFRRSHKTYMMRSKGRGNCLRTSRR